MKHHSVSVFFLLVSVFSSSSVHAQLVKEIHLSPPATEEVDPFHEIASITITAKKSADRKLDKNSLEKARVEFQATFKDNPQPPAGAEGSNPLAIADVLLKAWDVVREGQAVVNVESNNVKALPNVAKDRWESLTGWKPEHGVEYGMQFKNYYGITVMDIRYDVRLIYGGSVKKNGRYIASARVIPRFVDVLWGFNVNVQVRETAIQNLGTEKDPFAAISLDVILNYGSFLRRTSETVSFRLDADGAIFDLSNGKAYFANHRR